MVPVPVRSPRSLPFFNTFASKFKYCCSLVVAAVAVVATEVTEAADSMGIGRAIVFFSKIGTLLKDFYSHLLKNKTNRFLFGIEFIGNVPRQVQQNELSAKARYPV